MQHSSSHLRPVVVVAEVCATRFVFFCALEVLRESPLRGGLCNAIFMCVIRVVSLPVLSCSAAACLPLMCCNYSGLLASSVCVSAASQLAFKVA